MGIKSTLVIFCLLCFFGAMIPAQDFYDDSEEAGINGDAQDEGEPNFRLSDTDAGLLFVQRLTWEEAQYAVRYHVILERKRETTGQYTEVLRRNLDAAETYVDISVPAGEYRFKVFSFNILGLLDSESDWEYFEVLKALYPVILEFSPQAFYLDRLTPRILHLTGENLILDADIYLEGKNVFDESGQPVILKPVERLGDELGESIRLIFDEEDLIAGIYEIFVINPGGFISSAGNFSVAIAKPFDINVSLGYSPMVSVTGLHDYFLDHVFIPVSFSARGNFIPFKLGIGFFGAELNLTWSLIGSDNGEIKTSTHLLTITAGALYQYWIIKNKLSINARLGFGITGYFNWKFEYYNTGKSGDPMNLVSFAFNMGPSVQWFFYKQIFIEGGVDYIHVAQKELPLNLIRIGLYGGYQF